MFMLNTNYNQYKKKLRSVQGLNTQVGAHSIDIWKLTTNMEFLVNYSIQFNTEWAYVIQHFYLNPNPNPNPNPELKSVEGPRSLTSRRLWTALCLLGPKARPSSFHPVWVSHVTQPSSPRKQLTAVEKKAWRDQDRLVMFMHYIGTMTNVFPFRIDCL